mmetsp:Transcript_2444/g.8655  ORF Transcript_2444/g.8655 Transcript_2444/m.8655 type:complete len:208 (+) Transcript_2444:458-1081(+)
MRRVSPRARGSPARRARSIWGARSWSGHIRPLHALHPRARGAQAGQPVGQCHVQERGGRRGGLVRVHVRGLRRDLLRQLGHGARPERLGDGDRAHGRSGLRKWHVRGPAHDRRLGRHVGVAAAGPGSDAAALRLPRERLRDHRFKHHDNQGRDPDQPRGGLGELERGRHGFMGGALAEQRHVARGRLRDGHPDNGRRAGSWDALGKP